MKITPIELSFDDAHVWVLDLDQSQAELSLLESWLAVDELARADRFVTEQLRNRFVVTRGRLRQILGTHLDLDPAEVQFWYEQWGKPQLTATRSNLHFNVSHSGDCGLIAISSQSSSASSR